MDKRVLTRALIDSFLLSRAQFPHLFSGMERILCSLRVLQSFDNPIFLGFCEPEFRSLPCSEMLRGSWVSVAVGGCLGILACHLVALPQHKHPGRTSRPVVLMTFQEVYIS